MHFTVVCDSRGKKIQAFALMFREGKCCSNYKLLYYSPQLLFDSFSFCFTAEVLSYSASAPVHPQITSSQTWLCLSIDIPFIPFLSFLLTNAQVWFSETYDFDLLVQSFTGFFLSLISFPSSKTSTECRESTMHWRKTTAAGLQGRLIMSLQPLSHSSVHVPASIFRGTISASVRKWTKKYSHNILAAGKIPSSFFHFSFLGSIYALLPSPVHCEVAGELKETPTK